MDGTIECVTLSDDDVVAEELPSRNKKKKKDPALEKLPVETVHIDLEQLQEIDSKENVHCLSPIKDFKKIQEEDKQFAELLQKCIDLEFSEGMIKILNTNVLNAYRKLDKNYRKSPQFNKLISKTLKRLCAKPMKKFRCINDLVATFKLHEEKKRVQLTTIETNITKNQQVPKIVLDSDGEQEAKNAPVINLDDEQNEVIDLVQDDKEAGHRMLESQEVHLVPKMELPIEWYRSAADTHTILAPAEMVSVDNSDKSNITDDYEKTVNRLKYIDQEIKSRKDILTKLEESEVCDDSKSSPYIMAEKYQVEILELYKEYCQIVGQQPVKRRKVRLQVSRGHPAGPVRKLEHFLNDSIGEDGQPLFPDFCDVVKCVIDANAEDNLGWCKQQVMAEANALFIQCGRALQKRRQRREYKDLLSTVNLRQVDYDPADEDPELLARLQHNRTVALKKESDLLERYTQLQHQPPAKPASRQGLANQTDSFEKLSIHNAELSLQNDVVVQLGSSVIVVENKENADGAIQKVEYGYVYSGAENQMNGHQSGKGLVKQNINSSRDSAETVCVDESDDFEPPRVSVNVIDENENTVMKEHSDEDNIELIIKKELQLKQEPVDAVHMLEGLSDDYTTSIADIEDPFLVIEISSDSSDDDTEARTEPEDPIDFKSSYLSFLKDSIK